MRLFNRLAILSLIAISVHSSVFAQTKAKEEVPQNDVKANVAYGAAEELYQRGEFYSALPLYQKAYTKETVRAIRTDIEFKIGDCYKSYGDYKSAEEWFSKAQKNGYDKPIVLLYLADCQKAAGAYNEALTNYREYRQVVPDDPRGSYGIRACEKAREWINNPTKVVIENMNTINTKYSDFAPFVLKRNPNVMYFTSARAEATGQRDDGWTGQKYTDIFLATRDAKGHWSVPHPLPPPISTEQNEGSAILDKRGNTMMFTRCLPSTSINNTTCDIFITRKKGETWEVSRRLNIVPDSITIGHPSLSPDEMAVFFTAIMPGGYGGRDIYVSIYDPSVKHWGKPINLGPKINTPGDEMYPYMQNDSTLYFSSNGLEGMGGLDIFKTKYRGYRKFSTYNNAAMDEEESAEPNEQLFKLTDTTLTMSPGEFAERPKGMDMDSLGTLYGKSDIPVVDSVSLLAQQWSDPENLKFPMNSAADDFALVFEEGYPEAGYLSSTRDGGKGGDDIYRFRIPALEFTIQGKVIDVDTRTGVKDATVELVGSDGSIISVKSDRKGNYIFDKSIVKPNTVYKLTASSNNYLIAKGVQSTVGLTQSTDLYQDAFLLKSTLRPIQLRNIFYDLDKSTLRPESQVALDSLVQQLLDNERIVIKINSHTDSRGDDKYNLDLSQRRSQSVVDYIITKGVDPDRLVAQGYGETRPIISDQQINKLKTPEEQELAHAKNRRTEFEVLRSDFIPKTKYNKLGSEDNDGKATKVSRPIISEKPKQEEVKPQSSNKKAADSARITESKRKLAADEIVKENEKVADEATVDSLMNNTDTTRQISTKVAKPAVKKPVGNKKKK